MTLRDILARDSLELTSAAAFGELLEYRPRGDAAAGYQVAGVVDRLGILTDDEGAVAFKTAQVFLRPVGASLGLAAAPVPGDVVVLAFDEGATPAPGRVRSLVSQDAGGYLLEVVK